MARGLRPLAGALLLLEVAAAVSFVHHRYEEMVQALFRVQSECPYVSRVYSIGRSVEGRHLYVLEFSDYPGIHEPREYGGTARDGTGRDGTGRDATGRDSPAALLPRGAVGTRVGAAPVARKTPGGAGGFWQGPRGRVPKGCVRARSVPEPQRGPGTYFGQSRGF